MRLLSPLGRAWRQFRASRRGTVLVEAAIAMPILLLLLLGGLEFGRYVLLTQKMQRAAMTVGDLIAREKTLTTAQADALLVAITASLTPFPVSEGRVIVSSITRQSNGNTIINWQRKGAGSIPFDSRFGSAGNPASNLGITLANGETVITAEVRYDYQPWVMTFGVLPAGYLYQNAYFRPRLSDLTTLG